MGELAERIGTDPDPVMYAADYIANSGYMTSTGLYLTDFHTDHRLFSGLETELSQRFGETAPKLEDIWGTASDMAMHQVQVWKNQRAQERAAQPSAWQVLGHRILKFIKR